MVDVYDKTYCEFPHDTLRETPLHESVSLIKIFHFYPGSFDNDMPLLQILFSYSSGKIGPCIYVVAHKPWKSNSLRMAIVIVYLILFFTNNFVFQVEVLTRQMNEI